MGMSRLTTTWSGGRAVAGLSEMVTILGKKRSQIERFSILLPEFAKFSNSMCVRHNDDQNGKTFRAHAFEEALRKDRECSVEKETTKKKKGGEREFV